MPTAAELVHDVNHKAENRGIRVSHADVDLVRMRAWKNSIRRDQDSWLQVLGDAYTTVPGEATFANRQTVRVGERELSAERILVATGSRTAVPPIPGLEDVDWLDHVSALDLERVPESLLVIGAGPVGPEFAQIFARFGSGVTIVSHGTRIAARADTEVADELQAALEDEGIEVILTDGGVERFTRNGKGLEAAVTGGRMAQVSDVLLASGRVPNIESLGLEAIGVESSRRGIAVDEHQRTPTASGPRATSPPGRCSPRQRSTRRASRSTTCSAATAGARSTASCRPRSSRIPSSAASASPKPRRATAATRSRSSGIRCRR